MFLGFQLTINCHRTGGNPDNKVHGANMGPTWVLSTPDGPQIGPMKLAIGEGIAETNGVLFTDAHTASMC